MDCGTFWEEVMALGKTDVKVMDIDPELAEKWLGSNQHNRNIRERLVDALSGAIARGEWVFNGDTIRFDEKGKLADGQHRLLAVIKSGKPIKSIVVTGLETSAQETMDSGAKRTLPDVLRLRGETNTALLAAAIRLHWRYHNTFEDLMSRYLMPTNQQLLKHLELNPHLREATRRGGLLVAHIRGLGSVYATAYALFAEASDTDVEYFFEKLVTGTELSADSPIYHLRQFLLRQSEKRDRPRQEIQLAMWIKAWNAYRDGRTMDLLIFRGGGKTPEQFPRVK